MPDYRRYYIPNALVFITVVTRDRNPLLGPNEDVDLLWDTIRNVQKIHSFHFLAYAILPDHAHWLMRVDNVKGDYSKVMHSIKRNYTVNYKKRHSISSDFTVWQKRFWDHVIRDDYDLSKHLDYIHWNPVKHGYVKHPEDWPHSSIFDWFERGYYPDHWGWTEQPHNIVDMSFE
jgi:putative transposase